MDFTIAIGYGGWILLILGAAIFGGATLFVGDGRSGYDWLITTIAALIGAVVASEFIVATQTFEPVWDGVALVPALVGGIVLGTAVDLVVRYVEGGTPAHTARPA